MKLPSKGVLDDHDDNFAIVFAAMGVSMLGRQVFYSLHVTRFILTILYK